MKKIAELTEEEIRYIANQIHIPMIRMLFQKNSKGFAKIKPGFRPNKLSDADTLSLFVRNINEHFINLFLDNMVSTWLQEITENRDKLVNEGCSEGEALLKTISESIFKDNCDLYFKLTENVDTEYIKLFKDAMAVIGKTERYDDPVETGNDDDSTSELLNAANEKIAALESEIEQKIKTEEELTKSLQDKAEQLEKVSFEADNSAKQLHTAQETISKMEDELKYYRYLDSHADVSNQQGLSEKYQYVSIGQIYNDYNGKIWINRLADVVDGKIVEFHCDYSKPRYYQNRDRLPCRQNEIEPMEDGAIVVWKWNASIHNSDPAKDHIVYEHDSYTNIIEIVDNPQCYDITDLASLLTHGIKRTFTSEKILFVYMNMQGITEGLLCSAKDFECSGTQIRLVSSVFTLPHYVVRPEDIIMLAGKKVHRYLNLGIPKSVFKVRTVYDAIKEILLSRITIPVLRDQGLSKKEAQNCRNILNEIPAQTLTQELAKVYNCSKAEAERYVDEFIRHINTYLSKDDIDMNIISEALSRNPELVAICKQQLTEEWKNENEKLMQDAEAEFDEAKANTEKLHKEAAELLNKKAALSVEIEEAQRQIAGREQLAADVESKITSRIEEAKQNAADFISTMAFVSPLSVPSSIPTQAINTDTVSIIRNNIDSDECGDINDIEVFEDELSDNLELAGYDEEISDKMAQAISFCVCSRIPVIVGENAVRVARSLAATIGEKSLTEIFVSIQDTKPVDIVDVITNEIEENHNVILLHGIFDSYSINLYNFIVNQMRYWGENVTIFMSLQGISPQMIPAGVWNYSLYIDGDKGLLDLNEKRYHSYNIKIKLEKDIDHHIYKKLRNKMDKKDKFYSVLSMTQICMYARYLAFYSANSEDNETILSQMITTARSSGKEEILNNLFRELGMDNGIKMLAEYL